MERDQIIGAIAGAAAVVCAFLPWATVWIVTLTGIDGDGVISALAGLVGGIVALTVKQRTPRRILMAACGAIVAAVGLYHLFWGVGTGEGVEVGIGLYGTIPAGLLLGIVGLVGTGTAAPTTWAPPTVH